MYFDCPVLIASIPRKTVRLQRNKEGTTYIQLELSRTYKPDRKYNVAKRVIIGKVCPEDETKMLPNDHFLQEFPDFSFSKGEIESNQALAKEMEKFEALKLCEAFRKSSKTFKEVMEFLEH